MALAALEAGICINNSSVTLVHGLSRPIGALFHVAHGISNAMVLKACFSFALEGTYERFADLTRAIGVADAQMGALAEHLSQSEIELPLRNTCYYSPLAEVGVSTQTEMKYVWKPLRV